MASCWNARTRRAELLTRCREFDEQGGRVWKPPGRKWQEQNFTTHAERLQNILLFCWSSGFLQPTQETLQPQIGHVYSLLSPIRKIAWVLTGCMILMTRCKFGVMCGGPDVWNTLKNRLSEWASSWFGPVQQSLFSWKINLKLLLKLGCRFSRQVRQQSENMEGNQITETQCNMFPNTNEWQRVKAGLIVTAWCRIMPSGQIGKLWPHHIILPVYTQGCMEICQSAASSW